MGGKPRNNRIKQFATLVGITIITVNCGACVSFDSAESIDKAGTQNTGSHISSGFSGTSSASLRCLTATEPSPLQKESAIPTRAAKAAPTAAQNIAKTLSDSIYNPPYPGDYKLVKLGDEEVWQDRGEIGKFGGVLTVSDFGSGPKTFNCWAASDAESGGFASLMYESLLGVDPWTAKFYPRLAKSFVISPDYKTYTFTLRKGLRWSDGQPLTADDVVYTFNTIIAKGFGNSSSRDVLSVYGHFPTVEKIDDLTVRFHTQVPFAPFLNAVGAGIAPKHFFEPITDKLIAENKIGEFNSVWDINCKPETLVVNGPFKLHRYLPGQRVELVPNPYYSMVDKLNRRLPYLSKFVVLIVPDQNTQLLKFYAGDTDMLDIHAVRGGDAALVKQKEKSSNFKMYNLGPDDGTLFLMFNLCRRKNPKSGKFYVDSIKQSWFNNDYFRQAISHTVDRKRMVANIMRGVGYELFTAESTVSVFFNKSLTPYPQDLEYASKLLAQGGFKKRDNILYDASGNRVEFTLYTNAGNSTRDAVCVMIQNDLKTLGIKVNYQPIDFNILVDKVSNSLDWEAVVMGLTGSRLEPYDGANVWKSFGRLHMFDQRLPDGKGIIKVTDARDWEKEIDSCFDKGATTLDLPTRHLYFNRYQQIAYDKQPFIYLFSSLNLTAARNTLGNYMPTPLGVGFVPRGSMHNIEEIFIRKHKENTKDL